MKFLPLILIIILTACMNNSGLDDTINSNTPPVWTTGDPAVINIKPTAFDVRLGTDKASRIRFVVVADGAATPSVSNLRAGSVTSALTQGSILVSGLSNTQITITNLLLNSTHDVHVMAEMPDGTYPTSMTKLDASVTSLPQYGDGSDGDIVILSGMTVNITNLYELDDCNGVITYRGTNKGLNHGAGQYNPKEGRFIHARTFLIQTTAVLTAPAWGEATDDRKGVVRIACTGGFTNYGTIDMDGKGGSGGLGQVYAAQGRAPSGTGPGGGQGGADGVNDEGFGGGIGTAAFVAPVYGAADILSSYTSNWSHIYGSGGGGGGRGDGSDNGGGGGGAGGGHAVTGGNGANGLSAGGNHNGQPGGNGGGAVRIEALVLDTSGGFISCAGTDGGDSSNYGGCGGGGSGGTILLTVFYSAGIGSDRLSCPGGQGGHSSNGPGGNGSWGRIHIEGPYTGSTSSPPIDWEP